VQGQGTSPVVVGDVVVLANDQEGPKSSLLGFDRRTGAMQWKVERASTDKAAMSTPVVFRPADGAPPQVVFTTKAPGFTAVDPRTGQVAWEAPKAFDARTVGSPIATDELVLAACGEGAAHRLLVAVRPGKPGGEPHVAYTVKGVAPYVPTPLARGDRLYLWGDAGLVTCLKLATGEQVWSEKVGGMYYGSPVCVGDTLWCLSRKGDLVGVRASDTFARAGKISLGDPSHATPAVAGGKMYLRTVTKLVCVNLRAG
jgi:outer membrane protein assembly factor BamB